MLYGWKNGENEQNGENENVIFFQLSPNKKLQFFAAFLVIGCFNTI